MDYQRFIFFISYNIFTMYLISLQGIWGDRPGQILGPLTANMGSLLAKECYVFHSLISSSFCSQPSRLASFNLCWYDNKHSFIMQYKSTEWFESTQWIFFKFDLIADGVYEEAMSGITRMSWTLAKLYLIRYGGVKNHMTWYVHRMLWETACRGNLGKKNFYLYYSMTA